MWRFNAPDPPKNQSSRALLVDFSRATGKKNFFGV
jgi:hypothetical protein